MSFILNSDRERAVVASEYVRVDLGFFNSLHEFLDDEEVVETPADIAVASAGYCIPIGIGFFCLRVLMTK